MSFVIPKPEDATFKSANEKPKMTERADSVVEVLAGLVEAPDGEQWKVITCSFLKLPWADEELWNGRTLPARPETREELEAFMIELTKVGWFVTGLGPIRYKTDEGTEASYFIIRVLHPDTVKPDAFFTVDPETTGGY